MIKSINLFFYNIKIYSKIIFIILCNTLYKFLKEFNKIHIVFDIIICCKNYTNVFYKFIQKIYNLNKEKYQNKFLLIPK